MFFQNYNNITDIIIPQNVHIPDNVEYCRGMQNLTNSLIVSKDITQMSETYQGCYNLTRSACGPNVTNMYYTYCDCYNLAEAVCGPNVTSMYHAYQNCSNLKNAACGPNVATMIMTYCNCYNLTEAVCGPNVTNMYDTYENCSNLKKAVCGPKVISMSGTYLGCSNLKKAVCGPNVVNMGGAYSYCYNLTEASCSSNVISLSHTYQYCSNLKNAVCGPNVINMSGTYKGCDNLVNAACGPSVIEMIDTYTSCHNLTNAACGPNVTYMQYTYNNCANLKNSVCGPNVLVMYETYSNCLNLTEATCGPNVTNMYHTYCYCYNLINAICDNNVTKMYGTYEYCSNLKNAEVGANVSNLVYAFYGCSNLQTLKVKSYYPPYVKNYTTFYMVPNSMTVKVPMSSVSTYQSASYWSNFQIVSDMKIHIYELENDIFLAKNTSKEISIPYDIDYDYDDIDFNENLQVGVLSADEESLTISNVYFENNQIYFTATGGEQKKNVPVLIYMQIRDVSTSMEMIIETGYAPSTYTVSSVSESSYSFVLNGDYYESNNKNKHLTAAICKVEIESNGLDRLYIDYIQTSESSYDFGIISNLDETLSKWYYLDANRFTHLQNVYAPSEQTIDYGIIPEGKHFIYIKYIKDETGSSGNDSLKFKLRFEREGG